jgi:uncharacterized protein (DUF427 family)
MTMIVLAKTRTGEVIAKGEIGKTVISLEGNYYFDKSVVDFERVHIKGKGQQYTCPIKRGTCDYYNLVNLQGDVEIDEVGWIYESVESSLFKNIEHRIAFYGSKLVFETL